jgi:hypothetical protein
MRGQTLSPPPPSSSRTLSGGVGCSPSSSGWVGREVGREVGRYQSVCTDHATTAAFVESDAVRRCRLLTVLVSMGRTQRIIPPDSWVGRTQGRTAVRCHLREAVSASSPQNLGATSRQPKRFSNATALVLTFMSLLS